MTALAKKKRGVRFLRFFTFTCEVKESTNQGKAKMNNESEKSVRRAGRAGRLRGLAIRAVHLPPAPLARIAAEGHVQAAPADLPAAAHWGGGAARRALRAHLLVHALKQTQ
jgi:hypothetical protein